MSSHDVPRCGQCNAPDCPDCMPTAPARPRPVNLRTRLVTYIEARAARFEHTGNADEAKLIRTWLAANRRSPFDLATIAAVVAFPIRDKRP